MSKPAHILISSMHFYPENFRVNDIALEWVRRGYKVSVITGYPNYPEGKLYKGYKQRLSQIENYQDIRVHRIPIFLRGKRVMNLILNYLSFIFSGYFWALLTQTRPDKIFIFATSPIFQALPPVLFSRLRKIPCSIYVQDLWPENVEAVFNIRSPFIIKPIEWVARYVYKRCDKIFVTSPQFVQAIARLGISQDKIIYWPQHAEFITLTPISSSSTNLTSIIYAGNVGQAQGLDTLVSAIEILKTEGLSSESLKVSILGDGRYKEELKRMIEEKNLESFFQFLPRVQAHEVPNILAQHSLSYLSLQDSTIFNMTIPAKLQTYLGAGVPILACANGEVPRILDESKAGLWAPSGDAKALAFQIRKFIQLSSDERTLMGQRGAHYCKNHFDKKMLFDQMDFHLS